jgi:hypothetical protein
MARLAERTTRQKCRTAASSASSGDVAVAVNVHVEVHGHDKVNADVGTFSLA